MAKQEPVYIARRAPRARVQLRLTIPLRDRLLQESRDAGVSLNVYVEAALTLYLEFLRDNPPAGG
jgi:predicted HicB family RNase H-like nuclease